MIQVSDNYAELIDIGPYRLQLTLADGTIIPEKAVRSAELSGGSNAGDDFTLGSTVAAKLALDLDRPTLGAMSLADARLQAKLILDAGEDPLEFPWGDLKITEADSDDDAVTVSAGDAMLWAFNAQYDLDDEALGFDWEAGVDGETLLQAICDACGVTLGSTGMRQITLNHVSPSGYTYREVIAFLACMWGRFARINGVGELVLQWYSEADRPVTASRYYSGELVKADYAYTVGYIKCYVETLESTLEVGDTTQAQGAYIKCPWMTQECLDAVWGEIGGFTYRPVSELAFLGDPRLEPGDVLQVADRDGMVHSVPCMTLRHQFDGGLISEITAVGKSSSASGSDYQGPVTRMIERAVAGAKADLINYGNKIDARVTSVSDRVTQLELSDGQVLVSVEGKDGTLTTTIDASTWEAIKKNLKGETTSGFYYDFDLGRFVYNGTGVFTSEDGETFIEIDGNELVLYSAKSGTAVEKLRIGVIEGRNPSDTEDVDYPYILLGNSGTTGGSGLVKKFWNGLFIGNSYAKSASGEFSPEDNYAGFFINTNEGKSYVVQNGEMMDVYTGAAIAKFK